MEAGTKPIQPIGKPRDGQRKNVRGKKRKREKQKIMASKIEFVEFIVDQLQEAGLITYKKMFGEYGIYCDGKIFALICNNQFFLKLPRQDGRFVRICVKRRRIRGRKIIFSWKKWRTGSC